MKILNINSPDQKIRDVRVGQDVQIWHYVNLYECEIGDGTMIGTFVEIQNGVQIGARCRIQSHTFICAGVTIEDDVFIGHGVMFINDLHPVANGPWEMAPVQIKQGASIGSNATILGGVTIGRGSVIGAGAVVTKDVPDGITVVGNPARPIAR